MAATPRPWASPVANVFRVIAPYAPHKNQGGSGSCPPYPWAIICDMDTDSVDDQAADNAILIVKAVNAWDDPAALAARIKELL